MIFPAWPLRAGLFAPIVLALAGCPGRKAPAELASPGSASAAASPAPLPSGGEPSAVRAEADGWRRDHRIIDLHQHIEPTPEAFVHAMQLQNAVGVGLAVDLSGSTVTPRPEGPSAFEQVKAMADQYAPGHFVVYMNLDYADWDLPDFSQRAVRQVERGAKLGAAGFKEFKRLGLYLHDKAGKLIRVDDPKLDGVWKRCGELGMPVSIHVADPKAFWLPLNPQNERWDELQDHPKWWFGDPTKYPPREELLDELDRVIGRHPETTFVSVHFGANAEDIAWVDAALDRHPNMLIDLAARVPEVGRHDPDQVRAFFIKHQDRILFATDLSVGEDLVLGSGGDGPPPTDKDAVDFFQKHWRWLETRDKNFPHMTPIQGRWTISGIGLPASVLRKVYFDNALKLLARSLPKR